MVPHNSNVFRAMKKKKPSFSAAVLAWYDVHARTMPWRAMGGIKPDPYKVWLSEIMLQQTTVVVVGPYFEKFLSAWPTVEALSAASLDDVLRAWAGLGYYARGRNLKACADVLVAQHGSVFPKDEKALCALPGIGPYTAAAIASIAFERKANVVDGNVERVMARIFAIEIPLPQAKSELRERALGLLPDARFGDYAQGLMDLGATVCTPRSPKCASCPVASFCLARKRGIAAELPARAAKQEKPRRRGAVFWLQRGDGAVLLRRRPARGLLGGMMEVPSGPWGEEVLSDKARRAQAPLDLDWELLPGMVRHTFTHFHLELEIYAAKAQRIGAVKGEWVAVHRLEAEALPSVMKKVVRHALAHFSPLP